MDEIIIREENDIKMYNLCLDNIEDIIVLMENDFFNFRGGSYTVHRDADGKLRKIDRNDTVYKS